MPFWPDIVGRNKVLFENWLSEQFEFLLQIASVAIANILFQALHLLGLQKWLIDFLEELDSCAIILVFALFLITVVRRAIGAGGKLHVRR